MQITITQEKCIGCGACQAVCPKFFELKEDGKSHLIGESQPGVLQIAEKAECPEQAAETCPAQCIEIQYFLNFK